MNCKKILTLYSRKSDMVTKAELQVQLRALMRGGPGRLPISSMKKHELEAYIDAVSELKGKATQFIGADKQQQVKKNAVVFAEQIGPAKTGPSGPRPIPVEEVELDDDVIRAPGAPPIKLKKAPRVNRTKEERDVEVIDTPAVEPMFPVKPLKVKEEPRVKATYCGCNCPSCPHKHRS